MIRPSKEQVKIKAQNFILAYEEAEKRYTELLKLYNKNRSRHLKQWAELEVVREKFDDFQNAINAYYNQLVKIMYVYTDPKTGAVTLSSEENSSSLLSINKDYKNVQYHLNSIKNKFKLTDYDSSILDATEQSIYSRWQIAKSVTKQNRFLPILWKINGVWAGAKINNLGTIAEAYVNFYLAKYEFSKSLEQDVQTYILHPSLGAASVDNMSGFLVGDTSALNGRVQFAVKKDTASPIRLKTIYEEVKKIIYADDFDIDILWNRFVNIEKQKSKKNQVKKLSTEIEKTYESLIAELDQELQQ